jgi:putative FmdB family regulatory protein
MKPRRLHSATIFSMVAVSLIQRMLFEAGRTAFEARAGLSILGREMPIYEYRCENGHTFEVLRKMTDDPITVCETCEQPVEQVFHPITVHFKGSGFYNTDYGTKKRAREVESNNSSKKADKAAASASSGDSKSDTKTETKTETKSEAKSEAKTEAKVKPAGPKKSD